MGPLTILVSLLGLCSALLNTDVQISDGPLRGEIMRSRLGREFVGFKGIPYAEPPVGQLRFAPAQLPSQWTQVRESMRHVPQCPQRNMYQPIIEIAGEEDCLYLSVYTPSTSTDAKLPVMLFIHGGGLEIGQGFVYEPDYLLDKDIVLVIINYRLGPLGFLSTGDTVCPGNEGLKDQVVALKWVRNNIKNFGGDPELITLFGQSAGAAAVEAHLYSPLSEGLFHRAILQSGSSLAPWFTMKSLTFESNELGSYLGCPTYESKALIECLRDKKAEEIIRALTIFEEWERDPQFIFRAVVENEAVGSARFLTEHPMEAMNPLSIEAIPVMLGMNSDDGFFKATELVSHPDLLGQMSRNYKTIMPYALQYKYSTNNPKAITDKIMKFYFDDSPIGKDNIRSLINVILLMTMNEMNLLLDLFPEIIHNNIFPELTAHELLNLLQINNKHLQNIVLEYIRNMKTIKFFRNVDEVIKEDLSIHQVTLEQIRIFHRNCRNLRVLDLRGCQWLTDAHLTPFLWENRETLESLKLDGCFKLSDPFLVYLNMCKNLSYLAYNHIRFESKGGFSKEGQEVEVFHLMNTYHSHLPYLSDRARVLAQASRNFRWDELNEHLQWDVKRRIEVKRRNRINLRE